MFKHMENTDHNEEKSESKMRRQREDMQVNIAGLRRNIMNLAHNYSDAQIKVREATSNDPWGPSSKLMSEIADLTYNVVAFTEIMQMIWKRLNDHGRNWRHVYKALLLLEYLIKTGSEKVASQCKENIFAIQTLKDFQHFEDNKDQGINVREKAKNLVALLKDDERLRNERVRAFKAKERFAQSASAFGSDGGDTPSSPTFPCGAWASGESDVSRGSPGHQRFKGSSSEAALAHAESSRPAYQAGHVSAELECARPQTVGEEELQLQLALAMSREEAEQEEQKRRSDDVRLQLALSQSQDEFRNMPHSSEKQSHMLDLLDVSLGPMGATASSSSAGAAAALDPWGMPVAPTRSQNDPWSMSTPSTSSNDPWAPASESNSKGADPWKVQPSVSTSIVGVPRPTAASTSTASASVAPTNDPWSPSNNVHSPASDLDEFDIITNRERPQGNSASTSTAISDPLDLVGLGDALPESKPPLKKTPHSFLGENSALVNLDNLVTVNPKPSAAPVPQAGIANPFSAPAPQPISSAAANLFQQQQMSVRPTINQIRQQPFSAAPAPYSMTRPVQQPNPFLS